MTLQCEPSFRLEAIQEPVPLATALSTMSAIIHSAEHVRLWWFPYTDKTVVWRANRSTKPVQPPQQYWLRDRLLGYHAYQAALDVTRFGPMSQALPSLARFFFGALFDRKIRLVDESYKVFNYDCLFPQYVNEWAIPWERTDEALRRLDVFVKENDMKVHWPVEVRFADEDDVWLSPAYKRKTAFIGVIMYRWVLWNLSLRGDNEYQELLLEKKKKKKRLEVALGGRL